MPWHDIQMYVDGEAARDAAFNFVQRWNHHVNIASKYAGKPKYALLQVAGYDEYDKPPAVVAPQASTSSTSARSKKGKVDMPVSEKKKRKAELELERDSAGKSGLGADIDEEDEEEETDAPDSDEEAPSKSKKKGRKSSASKKNRTHSDDAKELVVRQHDRRQS